jgi:hypothetical protein
MLEQGNQTEFPILDAGRANRGLLAEADRNTAIALGSGAEEKAEPRIPLLLRAGQVIRMKISGHKTDSMERRYNIVDADDLSIAKEFMEKRMKAAESVAVV